MDTNLNQNPVNPNLEAFRKEMSAFNVTVYPDMLVYKLPSPKLREGCIPKALAIINRMALPIEAMRPGSHPMVGNTFIVKPKTAL